MGVPGSERKAGSPRWMTGRKQRRSGLPVSVALGEGGERDGPVCRSAEANTTADVHRRRYAMQ